MSEPGAIVVSGVGQRIGFHLAQTLSGLGYRVIGTYRTLRPAIEELGALGVELYQVDFYDSDSVDQFIGSVKRQHDTLRAVIHNASEWLDDATYEARVFEKLFQIHVHTPYKLNFAFASMLCETSAEFADIIHFSDYAASTGSAKHTAYAASKAALDNLTLSFATRYAPKIKVNSIAPGLILFNAHDSEAYKQRAVKKSLIQREGGVEEISDAVLYLLNSRYVTGRVLPVDGGRHLVKKKC